MLILANNFNQLRPYLVDTYSDQSQYTCEVDQLKFRETFRGFYDDAKAELKSHIFTRFFNASVSASEGNLNGLLALMKFDAEKSIDPYVEKLFPTFLSEIKQEPRKP